MPQKNGEHHAAIYAVYNGLNNKWNKCEVIVMGDKYAIYKLNGKIVNIATDLSYSEGLIGFSRKPHKYFIAI